MMMNLNERLPRPACVPVVAVRADDLECDAAGEESLRAESAARIAGELAALPDERLAVLIAFETLCADEDPHTAVFGPTGWVADYLALLLTEGARREEARASDTAALDARTAYAATGWPV